MESPQSEVTDVLNDSRTRPDYLDFDPQSLSEEFYYETGSENPVDKIDRLLKEEVRLQEYDIAGDFSVGVCFPATYENAVPNLGHQTVYRIVNERGRWYATRVYAPSARLRDWLIEHDLTYFTWEDKTPLGDHDVLCFTLTFEELAPRMLEVLDLGDVPLRSGDRSETDPLVLCGGQTPNYNPEPYAPFVDCFFIGEAGAGVPAVLKTLEQGRDKEWTRRQTLKEIAKLEGGYVPSFYDVEYDEVTGELVEMIPTEPEADPVVRKTNFEAVQDDPVHTLFVTPNTIYHSRTLLVEVERGCIHNCNFCQLGNNTEARWLEVPQVEEIVDEYAEEIDTLIPITEATTPEHKAQLFSTIEKLRERYDFGLDHGAFTANQLNEDIIRILADAGMEKIIVAPETAEGNLRTVVGKEGFYADEEIFRIASLAAEHGIPNFGLFLLMNIPGQTYDDLEAVADLVAETRDHMSEEGELRAHVNPIFPKPKTPLQWASMERAEESLDKVNTLSTILDERGYKVAVDSISKAYIPMGIDVSHHLEEQGFDEVDILIKSICGTKMQYSQPIMARGDRRVADVLELAYEKGNDYEAWKEAMDEVGLNEETFYRSRDPEERLPWEFIDNGTPKEVRRRVYESAMEAAAENR